MGVPSSETPFSLALKMDHPSLPFKATSFLSRELTMHFRVPGYDHTKHAEWPGEEQTVEFQPPSLLRRLRYLVSRKRKEVDAIVIAIEFAEAIGALEAKRGAAVQEMVRHLRSEPVSATKIVVIAYDADFANINSSYRALSAALKSSGFKCATDGDMVGDKRANDHLKRTFVMARTTANNRKEMKFNGMNDTTSNEELEIRQCLTDEDVKRKVFEVEGPAFGSSPFGTKSYYESYVTEGYTSSSCESLAAKERDLESEAVPSRVGLDHTETGSGSKDWIHFVAFAPFEPRKTRHSQSTLPQALIEPDNAPQLTPAGCTSLLFESPASKDRSGPSCAMIFAVGVLEPYRGKEIARALVEKAVDCAAQAGSGLVLLSADSEVIGLYQKCGFQAFMQEKRFII